MSIIKQLKDQIAKTISGTEYVPRGLFELSQYFRLNDAIKFDFHKEEDRIVAVSKNFRFGSIVTSGKNKKELDENIKDAILTAFDLSSAYKKEANIHNKSSKQQEYALA
jgi:hypothetical protein